MNRETCELRGAEKQPRDPAALERSPTPEPQTAWAVREAARPWGEAIEAGKPGEGARLEGEGDDSPASYPDPFEDPDTIADLEDEITTLAAHIHAATHRLLTLLAEFDHRGGWKLAGHRNCAEWLHFRTGIARSAARENAEGT